MGATFRLSQVDTRRLQRIVRDLPSAADDALGAAAQEALERIQLSFGSGPAGETYRYGNVEHVASAKGHPPNIDTGALRASMRVEKAGTLEYQVMDGVEYGVYLELGTERMAARPFVTPVIEEMRQGELGRMMKRFLQATGAW